jgi:hypothetical protein
MPAPSDALGNPLDRAREIYDMRPAGLDHPSNEAPDAKAPVFAL